MKYLTLLKILDKICEDAPSEFSSYKVNQSDIDALNQAKSKAFIHLFLKVKCGVMSFEERHRLITDGTQDGGLDAYHIDRENKKLFLIQSKFRTNENNFESKKITAEDLVTIEVQRILKGEEKDSRGNEFSTKVKAFQREWSNVGDQAHYQYKIIILGNLRSYTDEQIRRLIDNSNYEIFDFSRSYNELVFPLCSGTYYDPKEIKITIDLLNKEQSTLKQKISTNLGDFPIRVLFVPTKEIGRIMSKYKNAILKYNPRNYLSLSTNKVNRRIKDSIINSNSNDFAIFNNGITVTADSFELTESTGTKYVGQIIMTNPQIINGGQTAYVLSEIYEGYRNDDSIFGGKEVMLKVMVLTSDTNLNIGFIEQISNATNQQTRVGEADRRSNDKIQIAIQKAIFDTFGHFYERKKGEFYNGIFRGYIDKSCVIDRYDFLKAYLALQGDASNARRSGKETLFKEKRFKGIMKNYRDVNRMFFAHRLLVNIDKIDKELRDKFGLSLRYGKMAIISAIGAIGMEEEITKDNVDVLSEKKIKEVTSKWKAFENEVVKKQKNKFYFSEGILDYDNYYKGSTVNSDIKEFFSKKDKSINE